MPTHSTQPIDIFIEGWGRLGPYWGINKVMAEIHALLYLSPEPLTLEQMSRKLKTSRSNISTNVRHLVELGVVKKVVIRGERRDYYEAEEDIGKVAKLLAVAKKRKELDPAMEIVDGALEGARRAGAGDDAFLAERLGELKRHMDFVNAIFHAFVGGEAGAEGLANVIRIKENR
jgi:DNA-binding transcriptional regulator GbsR (MarR family)